MLQLFTVLIRTTPQFWNENLRIMNRSFLLLSIRLQPRKGKRMCFELQMQ